MLFSVYNHCTTLWTLSVTTRVSRYRKEHSPTHTYCGHQSSLISFLLTLPYLTFGADDTIRRRPALRPSDGSIAHPREAKG